MSATRIVVFAKAPQPGRVKTRLIPALGAEGAAALAARMLARTLAEAAEASAPPGAVASMVRGEATGATGDWRGDVAATAKRTLKAGEKLDGEGGFTVYGKLMQTPDSLRLGALPIGLAHNMVLKNDVQAGQPVRWSDVDYDATKQAVAVRREMEAMFRKELGL